MEGVDSAAFVGWEGWIQFGLVMNPLRGSMDKPMSKTIC
jgi:hypothetical protein